MLHVKDLMVEDWIKTPYDISRIETIYGTAERIQTSSLIELSIDEIEPIPLTLEILEKNGWRSRLDGSGEFYLEKPLVDDVIVTKTITVFQMNHGSFCGLSIHYVHELQHALRLCGIEKEITL